jgi:putative ABC transport system ATP-binding protein
MSIAVDVRDVVKIYAAGTVRALDGVSLSVGASEWVAITGPSGSGKSTLLHLLAALDVPTSGSVVVDQQDLRRRRGLNRYRRETIGLVFQLHNLLPHLDARHNVEIAMFGTQRSRHERRERAELLLREVDLSDKVGRTPPELSGGERQRVALARALANEPRLLLADEPTGSLDPDAVRHTLALLDRLRAEHGLTIVMVTHDPEAAAAADRILVMEAGRIREPGVAPVTAGTVEPPDTMATKRW